MRLNRGLFVLISGFFAAGLIWILVYPPIPLIQWTAQRYLGAWASWDSIERAGGAPTAVRVRCFGSPVRLDAARLELKHSLLQGAGSGSWSFLVRDAWVVPENPQWPSIQIASGEGRWLAGERKLELRRWTSELARVDADLVWNVSGRLDAANIRGEADPAELRKILMAWKPLPSESDTTKRLEFELVYERESLRITVNQKPFFRASWVVR